MAKCIKVQHVDPFRCISMHVRYVCQTATPQSATPRELKVRDMPWYRAYREIVFKQLEEAEEEKATGLRDFGKAEGFVFKIGPFKSHPENDGSESLFLSVLDMCDHCYYSDKYCT